MENVIEAVVMPLKKDAMEKAEQYARAAIAQARKGLKAAGNDLRVVAPYPGGFGGFAAINAMANYQFFSTITTWIKGSYSANEPMLAKVDSNKVAKCIKETRKHASEQYDLFIEKLNTKIGPATTARLDGNHVWSHSFLHVVTAAGEAQIWKTQTIMNTSKLGKVFPQFPTRKVKTAQ